MNNTFLTVLLAVSLFGSHFLNIYIKQPDYFAYLWMAPLALYACSIVFGIFVAYLAKKTRKELFFLTFLLGANLFSYLTILLGQDFSRVRFQLAMVFGLFFLFAVLYKVLKKKYTKLITILSMMIGVSSILTDVVLIGQHGLRRPVKDKSIQTKLPKSTAPKTGASKPVHIYHLMFDAMSGVALDTFTDPQERAFYKDLTEGTYFANTFANGLRTSISTKQMFLGRFNHGDKEGKRFDDVLQEEGLETNYYIQVADVRCGGNVSKCLQFHDEATLDISDEPSRILPNIERLFYSYLLRINQPFLYRRLSSLFFSLKDPSKRMSTSLNLFHKFLNELPTKNSDHSTYNYMHLLLPHPPYIHDEHCRVIQNTTQIIFASEQNPEGYFKQLRCANRLIKEFIQTLKERGLYKSAFIIVQSDHGSGLGKSPEYDWGKFTRERDLSKALSFGQDVLHERVKFLLWIKRPNETEAKVSKMPVFMIDIAAMFNDHFQLKMPGLDGISIFESGGNVDEKRRSRDIGAINYGAFKFDGRDYFLKLLDQQTWAMSDQDQINIKD